LLFTRRLPDAEDEGREQEDFFISKKQNGNWGIAENYWFNLSTRVTMKVLLRSRPMVIF
jgi:hypothetical protein